MDPNELNPHEVFHGRGQDRMRRLRDALNKFKDEEWNEQGHERQFADGTWIRIYFEKSKKHPNRPYHPEIQLSKQSWDECDQTWFASREEAQNYAFHCLMVSMLERLVEGG
jgi:hypothetical protein